VIVVVKLMMVFKFLIAHVFRIKIERERERVENGVGFFFFLLK